MKIFRKISIVTAMVIFAVSAAPYGASAAEAVNVNMTISVAGSIEAACDNINVTDNNGNGVTDIGDALYCIHLKYGKTYESENTAYGPAITCLWGDKSGAYGYYLNDRLVMTNLDEQIKSGDYIAAYVYKDAAGYSDSYAYFDQKTVKQNIGDDKEYTFILTAKHTGFDENWNAVEMPLAGAIVKAGDRVLGSTDEKGQISLALEKGRYTITAEKDGMTLVPPVCTVNITDREDTYKVKSLINEIKPSVVSSVTTKKNIKIAVKINSREKALIKELGDMGFTVKYSYCRSVKKTSKYAVLKTKDTDTFINTKGKKGTKYYYKVKIAVYDENEMVAQSTLDQCSCAQRTWTR